MGLCQFTTYKKMEWLSIGINQLLMFFQKYQMEDLLTGYEICLQFHGQINQLYIRQLILSFIIFVVKANLYILLNWKFVYNKFYPKMKYS